MPANIAHNLSPSRYVASNDVDAPLPIEEASVRLQKLKRQGKAPMKSGMMSWQHMELTAGEEQHNATFPRHPD